MATTCDISFDEMAVALSYISLGSGAAAAPAASTARALPAAPAKKAEAPADDDVRYVDTYQWAVGRQPAAGTACD